MNADNVTRVAEKVVNGLQQSPMLLALLALNGVGIGAAVWFLSRLADASSKRWEFMMNLCLKKFGAS